MNFSIHEKRTHLSIQMDWKHYVSNNNTEKILFYNNEEGKIDVTHQQLHIVFEIEICLTVLTFHQSINQIMKHSFICQLKYSTVRAWGRFYACCTNCKEETSDKKRKISAANKSQKRKRK